MHLLSKPAEPSVASDRARAARAVARRLHQDLGLWTWVCLLVLVLLAQSLGQMHGVLHAGPPHIHTAAQDQATGHRHAQAGDPELGQLFGGHGQAKDCRLYDQISHAECMPAAALLLALVLPAPTLTTGSPEAVHTRPTLRVQARGPPLLA